MDRLLRHSHELSLKTRASLESDRADAISPETVAIHFARIHALCDKHDITNGAYILNLDEVGFPFVQ